MSFLLTMNLIQFLCSKSTVNYQLKTLQIVKFVTFLSQNDNMLFICVPSDASSLPLLAGYLLLGIVFYLWETMKMWARSIQPKFRPVRPGKVVHLKRWTSFFETFPVGPNRSIEFWTEIFGNFGWKDCALDWVPLSPDSTCNQPIAQRKILLDWYLRSTDL